MSKQLELDLASVLRDEGINKALANADKQVLNWSEQAFNLFSEYCDLNQGKEFMTEDMRWFAEERGLPPPPDKRAWGGVTRMAMAKKMIVSNGYAPQKAVNAHKAPKTVWVCVKEKNT